MDVQHLILRRAHKVVLPLSDREPRRAQPSQVIAALLTDCAGLGYVLAPEVIERARALNDLEIRGFKSLLDETLREMVGAHVTYQPMYPDFPAQVMDADASELYVNAMMHYLGDHLGQRILPRYEASPRPPLTFDTELKLISLGEPQDVEDMTRQLIASRTSLSKTDKQDLVTLLGAFAHDLARVLPERIEFKENLAFVAAQILQLDDVAGDPAALLTSSFQTATDVLRLAVAMSDGDVSLAKPTKFRSFKRRERRLLLGLLDSIANPEEDMRRHAQRWIRLGERVHPGEYADRFPKALAAFTGVREGRKLVTFNSRVEALLRENVGGANHAQLLELLATRPGEFARRLDDLLRDTEQPESVLTAFAGVVDAVATRVLIQLWTHLRHRNEPRALRVFFPKGDVSKAYGLENTLGPLDESIREQAAMLCEDALRCRFGELDPLGAVFVDPALRNYTVAMAPRSASKSMRALSRGTRLPLPVEGGDTLRLFLWWKEGTVGDKATGRVDIDLSAALYNERWEWMEHIAYTNLRSAKYRAAHSGDITSAPDGACEFIDLDLTAVQKHGARYVTFSIFSYTRQPFASIPECFAGWMMRKKPGSRAVFEPATVQDKVDLAADTTVCIPLIVDVKTREALWCDLALTRRPQFGVAAQGRTTGIDFVPGNNVENNLKGLSLMGRAMTSAVVPNLYDLFRLHAESRGTTCATREDADIVFAPDGDITPFDRERIAAEFL